MIELVVFDWNGTILADMQAVLEASNHQLKALGFKQITLEDYRRNFEVPILKFVKNLGYPTKTYIRDHVRISKLFHEFYELRAARCRTRAGTRKTLNWAQTHSIDTVLLSNHTLEGIYLQLARLRLDRYFSDVLANENTHFVHTSGKHHRLEAYFKTSHHKPSQSLIIGDSTEEITIGQDLGMITVAIANGHVSTERLRAAQPDYLINRLDELIDIIKAFK